MTPPEITQLELDAAIAEEKAAAARSRAKLAQLEHQRRLAGSAFGAHASGTFPWLILCGLVAFVAWATLTDPEPVRAAPDASVLSED